MGDPIGRSRIEGAEPFFRVLGEPFFRVPFAVTPFLLQERLSFCSNAFPFAVTPLPFAVTPFGPSHFQSSFCSNAFPFAVTPFLLQERLWCSRVLFAVVRCSEQLFANTNNTGTPKA
jgi:hypothetical protein